MKTIKQLLAVAMLLPLQLFGQGLGITHDGTGKLKSPPTFFDVNQAAITAAVLNSFLTNGTIITLGNGTQIKNSANEIFNFNAIGSRNTNTLVRVGDLIAGDGSMQITYNGTNVKFYAIGGGTNTGGTNIGGVIDLNGLSNHVTLVADTEYTNLGFGSLTFSAVGSTIYGTLLLNTNIATTDFDGMLGATDFNRFSGKAESTNPVFSGAIQIQPSGTNVPAFQILTSGDDRLWITPLSMGSPLEILTNGNIYTHGTFSNDTKIAIGTNAYFVSDMWKIGGAGVLTVDSQGRAIAKRANLTSSYYMGGDATFYNISTNMTGNLQIMNLNTGSLDPRMTLNGIQHSDTSWPTNRIGFTYTDSLGAGQQYFRFYTTVSDHHYFVFAGTNDSTIYSRTITGGANGWTEYWKNQIFTNGAELVLRAGSDLGIYGAVTNYANSNYFTAMGNTNSSILLLSSPSSGVSQMQILQFPNDTNKVLNGAGAFVTMATGTASNAVVSFNGASNLDVVANAVLLTNVTGGSPTFTMVTNSLGSYSVQFNWPRSNAVFVTPTLNSPNITGTLTGSIPSSTLSGTISSGIIPNLDASKITTGVIPTNILSRDGGALTNLHATVTNATDVQISGISAGDVLAWNPSTHKFTNGPAPSGSGGSLPTDAHFSTVQATNGIYCARLAFTSTGSYPHRIGARANAPLIGKVHVWSALGDDIDIICAVNAGGASMLTATGTFVDVLGIRTGTANNGIDDLSVLDIWLDDNTGDQFYVDLIDSFRDGFYNMGDGSRVDISVPSDDGGPLLLSLQDGINSATYGSFGNLVLPSSTYASHVGEVLKVNDSGGNIVTVPLPTTNTLASTNWVTNLLAIRGYVTATVTNGLASTNFVNLLTISNSALTFFGTNSFVVGATNFQLTGSTYITQNGKLLGFIDDLGHLGPVSAGAGDFFSDGSTSMTGNLDLNGNAVIGAVDVDTTAVHIGGGGGDGVFGYADGREEMILEDGAGNTVTLAGDGSINSYSDHLGATGFSYDNFSGDLTVAGKFTAGTIDPKIVNYEKMVFADVVAWVKAAGITNDSANVFYNPALQRMNHYVASTGKFFDYDGKELAGPSASDIQKAHAGVPSARKEFYKQHHFNTTKPKISVFKTPAKAIKKATTPTIKTNNPK